ncbi:MAG: F0F1 ATP synthase subunit B [Ilumatobacter sp.]
MIGAQLNVLAAGVLQAEGKPVPNDGIGSTSLNPFLAPIYEVIIGGVATLLVFALLYKFAWPTIAQAMRDRTARIQNDLDSSAAARKQAESDAAEIRQSLGDVDGERTRLFADADAEAATLLDEGRARLAREIEDMENSASAEIDAAAGRGADELRADIARYASRSIEPAVNASLDDAAQQDLIEGFIARVGSSNGGAS